MSQSSNHDQISCNRQPFLSEDGCDRGSVDIHRFDELPYCGDIDPTLPEIPPEIVDTPINIPVPPPCACFNIDYDMNLKYSGTRKFRADAEFRANGDCCEGNYVSEFNLQIPCPIVKTDKKTIQVGIGYGRGAGRKKLTYINENADSCTIRPENVDMELEIPCPIGETATKSIQVGIGYGRGAGKRSVNYINGDADSCTIHPENVNMNLEIPCPLIGREGERKIFAGIRYVDKYGNRYRRHRELEISHPYIEEDPEECTLEPKDVTLNMDIPCPFTYEGQCVKLKLRRKNEYGKWVSSSRCIAEMKEQNDCLLTIEPITIDIPCPLNKPKKDDKKRKLKAKIKWGRSSHQSDSTSIFEISSSTCQIRPVESASLELEIPCPLISKRFSIKTKTDYITGSKWDPSSVGIFITSDSSNSSDCTREFTIRLRLPNANAYSENIKNYMGGGMFEWNVKGQCIGPGGAMVCGTFRELSNNGGCGIGCGMPCDVWYYLKVEFKDDGTRELCVEYDWSVPSNTSKEIYIPIYWVKTDPDTGECKIWKDMRGAFAVQCWE